MWSKTESTTPTWTMTTDTHRATVHKWGPGSISWEVRPRTDDPWVREGVTRTVLQAKRCAVTVMAEVMEGEEVAQ
jgi:hypothetical protein